MSRLPSVNSNPNFPPQLQSKIFNYLLISSSPVPSLLKEKSPFLPIPSPYVIFFTLITTSGSLCKTSGYHQLSLVHLPDLANSTTAMSFEMTLSHQAYSTSLIQFIFCLRDSKSFLTDLLLMDRTSAMHLSFSNGLLFLKVCQIVKISCF